MDPSPLHPSLLRPPILHILRATGFTTTRPSVLDTLTDLASRHLLLLCTTLAKHASHSQQLPLHPHSPPQQITLTTVRLAMQEIGTFYPTLSEMEEQLSGQEDLRGVEAFIAWCTGDAAREIRRIADMETPTDLTLPPNPNVPTTAAIITNNATITAPAPDPITQQNTDTKPPDYLTQLKRKHAKTRDGEEARYAGTVLGRDRVRENEEEGIRIEGWEVGSLKEWSERLRKLNNHGAKAGPEINDISMADTQDDGEKGSERSGSSSPLSDISGELGE